MLQLSITAALFLPIKLWKPFTSLLPTVDLLYFNMSLIVKPYLPSHLWKENGEELLIPGLCFNWKYWPLEGGGWRDIIFVVEIALDLDDMSDEIGKAKQQEESRRWSSMRTGLKYKTRLIQSLAETGPERPLKTRNRIYWYFLLTRSTVGIIHWLLQKASGTECHGGSVTAFWSR